MQSKAATVEEYLKSLPAERVDAIKALRKVILDNLGEGFEEGMTYGMIGYFVPHSIYPAGYHCDPKQPLPYMGLASQKNHISFYMMSMYMNDEGAKKFSQAWKKTGRKLDMGKCCIRGRKLEDFALDVIADVIRPVGAKQYINYYETTLRDSRKAKPARSANAKPAKTAKSVKKKIVRKVAARKVTRR